MLRVIQRLTARFASLVTLAVCGSFIAFLCGYYGPGDPVRTILGQRWSTPYEYKLLKHNLGLDRPVLVQYVDYVWHAAHGDFGTSWQLGRPVSVLLWQGLGITLQLAAAAVAIMVLVGIPLGLIAALWHNHALDRGIVLSSIALHAIPPYVLAPILLVIFVLKLHLLPVTFGWNGLLNGGTIVPVLTLALGPLVFIVRQMRAAVLDVLGEDHIRTAEAMGLSQSTILVRHVIPNALPPVINQLGIIFGAIMVSTIFVETIFNIPGFGSLLFGSVTRQDFPVLTGGTIVAMTVVCLAYFVTDLLMVVADPRIRLG